MSSVINNINDLIKASDKFSMPDGKIEMKENGRIEFISKFPLALAPGVEHYI